MATWAQSEFVQTVLTATQRTSIPESLDQVEWGFKRAVGLLDVTRGYTVIFPSENLFCRFRRQNKHKDCPRLQTDFK